MTALPMFLLHESGLHIAVVAQFSVLDEVILRGPKRKKKLSEFMPKGNNIYCLTDTYVELQPVFRIPDPHGSALFLIGRIRIQEGENKNKNRKKIRMSSFEA
jgi:hypothetical protein